MALLVQLAVPAARGGETEVYDLSINKDDYATSATPGGTVTYELIVGNAGPETAVGTVTDNFPSTLTCSWTCTGFTGGMCNPSGNGNISQPTELPPGAAVIFTVMCTIDASATGMLSNTATVSTGAGDTDHENNTATDTDTLVAATATPTVTATRTPTATSTPTNSPTPTPSATPTHTATSTPTPTATPTVTPTATRSSTATSTATSTVTPTAMATSTPSPTVTPSPSATTTPTPTPTSTTTPSLAILDIDGNGETDALTDGVLVLYWLFGFSGDTLADAVGQSCTRCDAGEIESYLESIEAQLDIDSNGSTSPLSDGILVLRFLFAFTDGPLTAGAVDLDHCTTRCDAAAIEAYLQTLD